MDMREFDRKQEAKQYAADEEDKRMDVEFATRQEAKRAQAEMDMKKFEMGQETKRYDNQEFIAKHTPKR